MSGDMAGTVVSAANIGRVNIQTGDLTGAVTAGGSITGSMSVGGDLTGRVEAVKGILGDIMIVGSLSGGVKTTGATADISGDVTILGKAGITSTGGITSGRSILGNITVQNGGLDGRIVSSGASGNLLGLIYVFGDIGSAGAINIGGNVSGLGAINVGMKGTTSNMGGAITIGGDLASTQRYGILLGGSLGTGGTITIGGTATYGAGTGVNRIKVGKELDGTVTVGSLIGDGRFGDVVVVDSLNSAGTLIADAKNDGATFFFDAGTDPIGITFTIGGSPTVGNPLGLFGNTASAIGA
jgi:hypothetical protein